MRIAQVAPLWETVPPRLYGGTELVIHLLTEELVRQGHEVTLFSVGGSKTQAALEICAKAPLRELFEKMEGDSSEQVNSLYPGSTVSMFYEMQMWAKVFARANQFDVIHNHLGPHILALAHLIDTPIVTTLHGEFGSKTLRDKAEKEFVKQYSNFPFVSISNEQRIPCPNLNYIDTIYHGLDLSTYSPCFDNENKDYLAFLGRFCKEKGVHHAIRIARESGYRLIMAGKVDCPEERAFFRKEVEPYLDDKQFIYIGEVNHPQKVQLLRNAAATLCPVTWREPFGLVLIESMACGTPVLALSCGSIPEVVAHGVGGYVEETVENLICHVATLGHFDRKACRDYVARRFSQPAMVQNYVTVYQRIIEKSRKADYTAWDSRPSEREASGNLAVFPQKERILAQP